MVKTVENLRKKVTVGIVGGSDLSKIKEQLGATSKLHVLSPYHRANIHTK